MTIRAVGIVGGGTMGFGLPIGPLALADRMGLDEVNRWMQYLFDEHGQLKG